MGFRVIPYNRITVDSVETTNTRAVIIGTNGAEHNSGPSNNIPAPGCTGYFGDIGKWRIAVVNLRSNPISELIFDDPTAATLPCRSTRAHDVAITPNGQWAVVTTQLGTCKIDLTIWPPTAPQFYLDGTNPLLQNRPDAFVSDSVACTNTRAVVIGRHAVTGLPQVSIIDVNQPPNAWEAVTTFALSQSGTETILPTDVVIEPSERYAFVRCKDIQAIDLQRFRQYGRIAVVDLQANALVAEFDAAQAGSWLGSAWGLDQLEAASGYLITGGENADYFFTPNPPGQPTPPPSEGWIEVLKY
jgi:hypothetical protein